MSEADDLLFEATAAANLSDLFNEARSRAVVATDPSVLILVDSEDGMDATTNTPGPQSVFMALAYLIKSVLEAYPSPLEDQEGEDE